MNQYVQKIPLALFSLYFIRVSFFPITLANALVLAVLGASACYFEYKNHDKAMKDLEAKMNEAVFNFNNKAAEIQQIKDQIAGLKLSGFIARPMSR